MPGTGWGQDLVDLGQRGEIPRVYRHAMTHTMFGNPLAMYSIIEKSGKDWEAGEEKANTEEEKVKKEEAAARQSLADILNQPAPEMPEMEFGGGEAPAVPQWTPPPTITSPTIVSKATPYKARRTPTVLTGTPGSTVPASKGKKRLLGE